MKKTLQRLIVLNAVLAVAVSCWLLFSPHPLPAAGKGKPFEVQATLRTLAFGFGGLGLALWFLGAPAAVEDRRRLALGLGAGNFITAGVMAIQQSAIWIHSWSWSLVLMPASLSAGFLWAAFRNPEPEEPDESELDLLEIRQSWLRKVGQAAAQEERNRLARDLHDSIKQQLFSIKVSSAAAQERWERDPEGARKALADAQQSAQEAMVEMQALLHQLRPQALATIGLVEALREQCEALGYRTGAEVALELGDQAVDERLVPGAQETIFRIAQEALANVARHARAQHVRVELGCQGDAIVLRVQDDGQGFDPAATQHGMGLHNLEERARALGGRCMIESAPGDGTTVAVSIPLVTPPPAERERASLYDILLLQLFALPFFGYVIYSSFFSGTPVVSRAVLLVIVILFLFSNWQQARRESRGAPAEALLPRIWRYRNQALLCMIGFFWELPWGRSAAEGWTAGRLGGLALSLLYLGLAVFGLVTYHRATRQLRLRRPLGKLFSWPAGLRRAAVPLAFTSLLGAFFALFVVPAGILMAVMELARLTPLQLAVVLTFVAVSLYMLWRELPRLIRSQEATS